MSSKASPLFLSFSSEVPWLKLTSDHENVNQDYGMIPFYSHSNDRIKKFDNTSVMPKITE